MELTPILGVATDHEGAAHPDLAASVEHILQVCPIPEHVGREMRRRLVPACDQSLAELDRRLDPMARRGRDRGCGSFGQRLCPLEGIPERDQLEQRPIDEPAERDPLALPRAPASGVVREVITGHSAPRTRRRSSCRANPRSPGNATPLAGVLGHMGCMTLAGLLVSVTLVACTPGGDAAGPSPVPSRSDELPAAAPGRGTVVFSGDDGEIHLLSLPGGDDRTVTSFPGPQFDPDGHGRMLVFRDSRAGVNVNDDIAVIRTDGTRLPEPDPARRTPTSGDRSGPRTAGRSRTPPTRTACRSSS